MDGTSVVTLSTLVSFLRREKQVDFAAMPPRRALLLPLLLLLLSGCLSEREKAVRRLLETRECEGCDLTGANLEGANLEGANLREARLSGATWEDGSRCGSDSVGRCLR